jgi:hypothetical protein
VPSHCKPEIALQANEATRHSEPAPLRWNGLFGYGYFVPLSLVMRWVTTAQSGFIKHPLTPAHTWSTESLGIVVHGSVDEMSA